jgi:squalene synthase HpnC
MIKSKDPLGEAYGACEALARTHYENFPVASWLLPARMRPHVAAVYAFARTADDLADEGSDSPEERRGRLRDWQQRLRRAAEDGQPPTSASSLHDLMFVALGHTIRTCGLPVSLFEDLLSAFEQDTMKHRYDSWTDLFAYCGRSANPVGRLVLRIAGAAGDSLDRSSDALCTALQLTNFWQDFGPDWRAGRLYVPREVYEPAGASLGDLDAGRMSPAWMRAIADCAAVTRTRFDEGRMVCDAIRGRLRLELRLTWLGGRRVLDRVVRGSDLLLRERPVLRAGDMPGLLAGALWWKSGRGHGS